MARGEPMPELILTTEDRARLQRWTRRATTARGLAQRARITLAAAEDQPNDYIASGEFVSRLCSSAVLTVREDSTRSAHSEVRAAPEWDRGAQAAREGSRSRACVKAIPDR